MKVSSVIIGILFVTTFLSLVYFHNEIVRIRDFRAAVFVQNSTDSFTALPVPELTDIKLDAMSARLDAIATQ